MADDSFVNYFLKNVQKLLEKDEFELIKQGMKYSLFTDIPSPEYIKKIELADLNTPSIHDKILKCSQIIDNLIRKIIQYFFEVKKINLRIQELKKEKNSQNDTIFNEKREVSLYEALYQKIYTLHLFFLSIKQLQNWVIVMEELLAESVNTYDEYLNKLEISKNQIDDERIRAKGKILLILQQLGFEISKDLLPFINEYDKFLSQTKKEAKNEKRKN